MPKDNDFMPHMMVHVYCRILDYKMEKTLSAYLTLINLQFDKECVNIRLNALALVPPPHTP